MSSTLTLQLIDSLETAEALAPEWEALARAGGDSGYFRGPGWILPWYRAYRTALDATLHMLSVREDGRLVGLAPFYERTAKMGPVTSREVRLLGDAGPRPPALDLLAAAGYEERLAGLLVEHFTSKEARPWDVIDLSPLRDPSRARAYLAEKLDAAGRKVDSEEAGTALAISLSAALVNSESVAPVTEPVAVYVDDPKALEKGLARLRRLSRLEWAMRDEPSPIADAEATRLLHEVVMALGARGQARLACLEDEHGFAVAAALVVDDPPRATCVALALDPEVSRAARLLAEEARAAGKRGLRALDVVVGASEFEPPPLPVSARRALRLRAFNNTAAGTVARTYTMVKRRADVVRGQSVSASSARAAWTKIREAAANVAAYERLHLYRGQLWVRGIEAPAGLEVKEFSQEDYDGLPKEERTELATRLELDETYGREKWRRGDLVVLARLSGRPAGIAWCARSAVFVPEIGREVRPGVGECYIHDVFVAPSARGRNVAPAMLEDLARRLRARDVYRAWALIEPSNVASTRAFEKAAYVPVADVIYARLATADKLVLRPPDPEGKKVLGIP